MRSEAARFWDSVPAELRKYPRDIERAVAHALPLHVVRIPKLHVHHIAKWCTSHGTAFNCDYPDRALRGCLVAFRGQGAIFVDGTDPADETRFTIAHETGHFLADYADVRSAAIKSFGQSITAVLDGERQASPVERVAAMLRSVPIGVHTHLARRENANWAVLEGTESRADQLAVELLAPWRLLRTEAGRHAGRSRDEAINRFAGRLARRCGIPQDVAVLVAGARLPVDTRPAFLRALRSRVEIVSSPGNKVTGGQASQ